jgi:hypothetical protein
VPTTLGDVRRGQGVHPHQPSASLRDGGDRDAGNAATNASASASRATRAAGGWQTYPIDLPGRADHSLIDYPDGVIMGQKGRSVAIGGSGIEFSSGHFR